MLLLMRILVVEDDRKIASFVVNGLKQSGYAVDHCADGEEGSVRAQTIAYDTAVADLMMTKKIILEHIVDNSFDQQTNVVDVLVHRLRSKLDKDKAMIHTIRGVGYVLRPA